MPTLKHLCILSAPAKGFQEVNSCQGLTLRKLRKFLARGPCGLYGAQAEFKAT